MAVDTGPGKIPQADARPSVHIAKWSGDPSDPGVAAGLAWAGFSSACTPSTRVFLKPNLTYPSYLPGVMTGTAAIEAVLRALRPFTKNIFIGDSDSGGYNRFSMETVYRSIGLYELARRYDATIVNLSDLPGRSNVIRCGGREVKLNLPGLLLEEIDVLISMPVPKIHMYTGVSLSLKNLWGCIPSNRDRVLLHPWIDQILGQLQRLLKAKCTVIDGHFGLNRSGPMLGDPVKLEWMLVADDLPAADRTACRIMRIDWRRIGHLRGSAGAENPIRSNADPSDFQSVRFFLRRAPTDWPGWLAFRVPWIARLAYVSRAAGLLHRILYLFRTPLYDYSKSKPISEEPPPTSGK